MVARLAAATGLRLGWSRYWCRLLWSWLQPRRLLCCNKFSPCGARLSTLVRRASVATCLLCSVGMLSGVPLRVMGVDVSHVQLCRQQAQHEAQEWNEFMAAAGAMRARQEGMLSNMKHTLDAWSLAVKSMMAPPPPPPPAPRPPPPPTPGDAPQQLPAQQADLVNAVGGHDDAAPTSMPGDSAS